MMRHHHQAQCLLLLAAVLAVLLGIAQAFIPQAPLPGSMGGCMGSNGARIQQARGGGARRGEVSMMVFDFIRKRAEEGIAQVQNIASKTAEGKLAEALEDTAAYVRQRQEIDAENIRKLSEGLAKSRQRLMGDLDSIFGAKEDIGLTKTLDKVRETRK